MRGIRSASAVRVALATGAALIGGGALAAAPPPPNPLYAQTSMVGDLSLSGGWLSLGSITSGVMAVGGRFNAPLGDGWNLEPDVGLVSLFSPSVTTFTGVAHLYKATQLGDIGIFGGGGVASGSGSNVSQFVIGGEATYYGHPSSIFGFSAAYNAGSGGSTSYPLVNAYWDYFYNPDLKSTLDVAWSGGSSPLTTVSAAVTKRFTGTQWSAFLAGSVAFANAQTGYDIVGGFTWNFDAPGTTQYDHDRAVPFTYAAVKF